MFRRIANRFPPSVLRDWILLCIFILGATAVISRLLSGATEPSISKAIESGTPGLLLKEVQIPGCDCSRPQLVDAAIDGDPLALPERCPTPSSWYRGPKQKVISFSMYNKSIYLQRIPGLSESAEKLYPSSDRWVLRIYHDVDVESEEFKKPMCNISCHHGNVDFCDMRLLKPPASAYYDPGVHPMIWRFMPIADEMTEVFLSRDLDSDLTAREVSAVNEWLKTDLPLHVMRDHPQHGTLILGGMWGIQKSSKYKDKVDFKRLEESMLQASMQKHKAMHFTREKEDIDQRVLAENVYPVLCRAQDQKEKLCLVHDSYLCGMYGDSVPWPTQRLPNVNDNFVGAVGHPPLAEPCPPQCRPKEHQDWTLC